MVSIRETWRQGCVRGLWSVPAQNIVNVVGDHIFEGTIYLITKINK